MEISDIRRARLRQWFQDKTLPPCEKSYLSQLMSGAASFGEKAARRLEKDYGMGDGYLDKPLTLVETPIKEPEPPSSFVDGEELKEWFDIYLSSNSEGRKTLMKQARALKRAAGRAGLAAKEQPKSRP